MHMLFKDGYVDILKGLPALLNESIFRIATHVLGLVSARKLVFLSDLLSFEILRKWFKESGNRNIAGLLLYSIEIHPIDERFDLRSIEDTEKIKIVVEEKVISTLSPDEANELKDFTQHNKLIIGGGESRALKNTKSHSGLGESLSGLLFHRNADYYR